MSEFETGYQALGSYYDDHDDQEGPPTHIIHAVPSSNKGMWQSSFSYSLCEKCWSYAGSGRWSSIREPIKYKLKFTSMYVCINKIHQMVKAGVHAQNIVT